MNPTRSTSPLRSPYTAKNPVHWWALRIADLLLSAFIRRTPRAPVAPPRHVLLASGGHLGDAVVLTASIRRVRELLPDAEIGVLVPSWSRAVVAGHPDIQWVHTIDHWRRNRASRTVVAKWRDYRSSLRAALREIRDVHYDAALDLYVYSPNMAVPLWRAGIPVRAGFVTGGLSPLYTHRLGWGRMGRHMMERHAELLAFVLGASATTTAMRYDLPTTPHAALRAAELVRAGNGRYAVVHMGSGRTEPTWPIEDWRALVAALDGACGTLVFTGRGEAELYAIQEVVQGFHDCVNLCDALEWAVFVELIRGATCVVTVDTAAAHVAAAVDTPSVVVWPDIVDDVSWHPHGRHVRLVSHRAGVAEVATATLDLANGPPVGARTVIAQGS